MKDRGNGNASEIVNHAPAFVIVAETAADVPAREALLDRAMGPKRRRKSSEKLRRGRRPSEGLAFVARDASGAVAGTVRLWDVVLGEGGQVSPSAWPARRRSHAQECRHRLGADAPCDHRSRAPWPCGAILLVGDAPYYERFGFSAEKTGSLAMPGPYERHRLLALELVEGVLDGAQGTLKAAGRKLKAQRLPLAA